MSMIRTAISGLGAALVLAASTPVAAQETEYRAIEAKNLASGKHSIAPDKGYILMTGPNRTNGIFVKTPDADDIAVYQAEWDKEFAEAVEKYPGRLERWKKNTEARRNAGDKPVEPTRENFSIGDIERRMIVSFGPQFVFEKGEDSFSYLAEVEPGTYTYYGPIFYMPNGSAMGTCYCMGSVKFEVGAGKITNLGNFLAFGWVDNALLSQASVIMPEIERVAVPVEYPVPASLAGQQVVQADLRAAGKMNNFFGVLVGRIPPVEGVLAYERDRIVDVKQRDAMAKADATGSTPATP